MDTPRRLEPSSTTMRTPMRPSSDASIDTETSARRSDSPDRPRRIGVFVAHFEDSFQRELWQAIRLRALEKGVSTIASLGHGLWSEDPSQSTSNIVYQMAGAPVIDGLIVFSNTLDRKSVV